jgi:hypothetical protein
MAQPSPPLITWLVSLILTGVMIASAAAFSLLVHGDIWLFLS